MMRAPSIADVPEHGLVEMLFRDLLLFENLAVPPQTGGPVSYRLRLQPADVGLPPRAFGDIDALLLSAGDAASARAMEYKRVKVTSDAFATGRPNKLHELAKAGSQVNAAAEAGFSSVWLQVIAVTDARGFTGGQFTLVPTFAVRDMINASIPYGRLHPAVGVHVMHLVQPVDKPVAESGQFGGRMERAPVPQEQPPALTAAIAALFASGPRCH